MKRLLRHSAALALGSGMLVCHLRAFQVESASGSVEGVVMDVATGMPMDGITVNGPVQLPPIRADLPPGVGQVLPRNIFANRPKATTDAEGRFVLRGLPRGPVEVTFEKDQYFLDSRFYTLPPAQQLNVGVIQLSRPGTISGRVLKPNGEPAVYVQAMLFFKRISNGRVQLVHSDSVYTDDRGEFRLHGLRPNRYWLGFLPDIRNRGPLVPTNSAFSELWTKPDPTGEGNFPVLYPGVQDLEEAEAITINGGEISLKDVVLGQKRLGVVRIHLVTPAGELPKDIELFMQPATPTASSIGLIRGGPPPDYCPAVGATSANAVRLHLAAAELVRQYWFWMPSMFQVCVQWATPDGEVVNTGSNFNFTGADIDVVVDTGKPDGRLDLRVMMEEADGTQATVPGVRPILCNAESEACPQLGVTPANGTIRLKPIAAGVYNLVAVRNTPPGSYIARAMQGNDSVLSEGIRITRDSVNLGIVLRRGLSSVQGTIMDKQGRILSGAVATLVPDSRLAGSRLQVLWRTARSDQDGRFVLSGITPGRYRIVARIPSVIPTLELPTGAAQSGLPVRIGENQQLELTEPVTVIE